MTRDESSPVDGWIVFNRVEIDLSGRRLFVADVEMPLEPKAFAVLALLVGQPGRAFTRDEILDAVWGHVHVTPGVLNRVITLLRQALGESAQNTQYLHTLHGVGYRFDAVVRHRPTRHDSTPNAGQDSDIAPIASVSAPAASVEDLVLAPAPGEAEVGADRRQPRYRRLYLLASALLLVLLVGASYWLSAPRTRPALVEPVLVVLPLKPVGAEESERILAEGLSEELITRLARTEGLRLISRTSAAVAQSRGMDLGQLADKLKVTHALEGSLRQAGQQLRIDLRLIDVPGGRTLWAQTYDRNLSNVFAVESEIAQAVARTLALRLGLASGAATAETDPELFRRYLEASRLTRGGLHAGREIGRDRGIAMLRSIIASAPDYARAHASLARNLATNLQYRQAPAGDIEEAAREAARAFELDPNLAETQTALALLACRSADWARCVQLFKRALALDPTDSDCRTIFAYWLSGIGYLDEALSEAEIGWTSDPLSGNASFVRGRILDTLGRHDEAERYLSPGNNVYPKWFNAFWRHDVAAARQFAEAMPENEGFRGLYLAATQALEEPSHYAELGVLIEASEKSRNNFNFLEAILPDPDVTKVVRGLELMLRDGWPSYYLILWMPEYSQLRGGPEFQRFLHRTGILDYWNARGWPPQCHAEGDRAVCP